MNINIRAIVITIAASALLSGCDLYGYGFVWKPFADKELAEAVALAKKPAEKKQKEAEAKLKIAQATVQTLEDDAKKAITNETCNAKVEKAVSEKACVAPVPVKKAIVTNRPAKPVYINKHASGGKTFPNSGPVAPPTQPTARAPGGCIYTSDGNLILKGQAERLPNGKEVARIADEDLRAKYPKLVASFPEGFLNNDGHKAMCHAWSKVVAQEIQSPEGRRVNDDTHRIQ